DLPAGTAATAARRSARRAVAAGVRRIDRRRAERERLIQRYGDPEQRPWIYLIVATGDIYEDIPQAQAAARAGADVIAVIRSTRQVHARAGIIINTGEDNYLTTADAVEAAHTVTVSQLLNEYFAHEAGLADWQLGLGHAFEINPDLPDSFRLELAHALLARELFPD